MPPRTRQRTDGAGAAGETAAFPLGPALLFLQRLWRLNHAIERLSLAMDRRFGVTAQQRFVIRCVGKFPGLTAGQLARILHVDPGTISTALGRLDGKGLIERRRDPVDSRRVTVGLTAAGRALDTPAAGTVEAAVEALLDATPPAAARASLATLDRLAALLERRATLTPEDSTAAAPRRRRRPEPVRPRTATISALPRR